MINPILPCRVRWLAGGFTEGGVVHLSGYRLQNDGLSSAFSDLWRKLCHVQHV